MLVGGLGVGGWPREEDKGKKIFSKVEIKARKCREYLYVASSVETSRLD